VLNDGGFRPASGAARVAAFLDAGGARQALSRQNIEMLSRNGWR
jgi:hypothetical protein